jgi:hypothetical protein
MRYILLLWLCLAFASLSHSQKTELRANAYSGLFFFRGSGSTSTSTVHVGDDLGYYNPTPYGRKSAFSYALELQAQRITRQKHLYGIGLGFERLTSRARVDSASYTFVGKVSERGKVTLENDFISFNPYIGHRFIANSITFDLQVGADLAFSTRVYEQAKLTSQKDVTYRLKKDNHPLDIRPRLQVNAYYNRMGFLVGYSLGLKNLYEYNNPNFVNNKAYANYVRIGVSYRIK